MAKNIDSVTSNQYKDQRIKIKNLVMKEKTNKIKFSTYEGDKIFSTANKNRNESPNQRPKFRS